MAIFRVALKAISWASGVELNCTKKRSRFLITFTNVFFNYYVFTFFNVFLFLFERFFYIYVFFSLSGVAERQTNVSFSYCRLYAGRTASQTGGAAGTIPACSGPEVGVGT